MKKIKILHKILLVFNLMVTLGVIHSILLYYNILDNSSWFRDAVGSNQIIFWAECINTFALITSLIYIQRSLFFIYSKGYFNSNAIKYLKIGGITIISVALIAIAIEYYNDDPHAMVTTTITSMFQAIIGKGCLIIVDILSKGTELKEDNDLTI